MLVVVVSLKFFDLLIRFTVLFVLSSWFLVLLCFVILKLGFRFDSQSEADVVCEWSFFSTVVAVLHPFVARWLYLPTGT